MTMTAPCCRLYSGYWCTTRASPQHYRHAPGSEKTDSNEKRAATEIRIHYQSEIVTFHYTWRRPRYNALIVRFFLRRFIWYGIWYEAGQDVCWNWYLYRVSNGVDQARGNWWRVDHVALASGAPVVLKHRGCSAARLSRLYYRGQYLFFFLR